MVENSYISPIFNDKQLRVLKKKNQDLPSVTPNGVPLTPTVA